MSKLKVGDLVWLRPPFQIGHRYGVIVSLETWRDWPVYRIQWPYDSMDDRSMDDSKLYFVNDVVSVPFEIFYREDFMDKIRDRLF